MTGPTPGGSANSPQTQQRIDKAVRGIVMDAFERARAILERHRDVLERCAAKLLARETLDEAMVETLTGGVRPPPAQI